MLGPLFKKTDGEMIPQNEQYQNYRLKTRLVCFFYDKDEFKEEIKNLKQGARKLSGRSSLRVAMVTNSKLVKQLKKEMSVKYFSDLSLSSCVLKRFDGEFIVRDMNDQDQKQEIDKWITINSKKEVDILDEETLALQQSLGTSMFLVFVDDTDKSHEAIKEIEKI